MINWIMERSIHRSLSVLITVMLLMVDVAWLPKTAIIFDWQSAIPGLIVPIALGVYAAFYTYIRASQRIASMALDGSILILFSQIGCVYGYLIATSPYPLQDAWLVSMDTLMGFDWLAYNEQVFSSSLLRMLSMLFYNLTLPLVVFTMIWFSLNGKTQRSREFVLSIILGAIVCITLSWYVPAVGAVGYYAPGDDFYNGLIRIVDVEFKQDYFTLRAHESLVFSMDEPKGLVAFPSYHVCMAILTMLAFRDHKRLLLVFAFISFGTILSTPIDGGHHLSDAIGGAIAGLFCFATVRYITMLENRRSQSTRSRLKLIEQ